MKRSDICKKNFKKRDETENIISTLYTTDQSLEAVLLILTLSTFIASLASYLARETLCAIIMLDWPRSPPPTVHREILTRLSNWLNSHFAHDMDVHFDFMLFFSEIVRPNSAAAPNFPSYQIEWCGGWVVWWLRTRASRWPPPPSDPSISCMLRVMCWTRCVPMIIIARTLCRGAS